MESLWHQYYNVIPTSKLFLKNVIIYENCNNDSLLQLVYKYEKEKEKNTSRECLIKKEI